MMEPPPGKDAASPRRWIFRGICGMIIFAVCSHIFLTLISDSQNESMIKRGDFPPFYAAAQIVREGQSRLLYDARLQQIFENRDWPSYRGAYLYFSYPVWFAGLFVPLGFFPPLAAKFIFTVLMILCLAAAVFFSSKRTLVWTYDLWGTFAFLVSFFPLTASILGGQNTALSMLCYSAMLYGIQRGGRPGNILAGIALGLWTFKIQYAGFFLVFAFLCGLYPVVLCALAVIILEYGLGGLIAGWDWPMLWLSAAAAHAGMDIQFNAYQMISFHGISRAAARIFGFGDFGTRALEAASIFLSALLFFGMAWKFWKIRPADTGRKGAEILHGFSLAGPAVLLISPHAVFYDIGIVLIAAAPYLDPKNKKDLTFWGIFWALGLAGMVFKQYLPLQPAFFLTLGALSLILNRKPTQ